MDNKARHEAAASVYSVQKSIGYWFKNVQDDAAGGAYYQ
jgi:hypothetical protein